MSWIRSSARRSAVIKCGLPTLRAFLLDIVRCAQLMPSLRAVSEVAPRVLHYRLEEFSNGAVRFVPDYRVQFELSDSGNIRWQPFGENSFRSSGAFRTEPGPTERESFLEISAASEAEVPVNAIMIPLLEPFANDAAERVTTEYLRRIDAHCRDQAS